MRTRRLATVTAAGAIVAGAALLFPASAQAAPTYWTFKNGQFGTCLTAGVTDAAYATVCNGGSHQQWDWIGVSGDYNQLKNRATGRCLMTDNKSALNKVWMSTCNSSATGQQWRYDAAAYKIQGLPGGRNDSLLRTSRTKDAVYSTQDRTEDDAYYIWKGSH
ncbi:ricin-type beta-trefoil lectin domain protein [Streptomyces sp. NPDC026206]|uniref:RICIN domain-containing protein n=1 Tax=Streptomyces sp. NPDC026206 TaxID=3157089 RepID=UPI0033E97E5A